MRIFEAQKPVKSVRVLEEFTVTGSGDEMSVNGPCRLFVQRGQIVLQPEGGAIPVVAGHRLVLRGVSPDGLSVKHPGVSRRCYRGTVRASVDRAGKLSLINNVSSLDYVVSVVSSETYPDWPGEALKAQAILTQTRLARLDYSLSLGDSTRGEFYKGALAERPSARNAVLSVWGNILTFKDSPITPFYHSTCAGRTSCGAEYFGKPANSFPYLQGVECNFCRLSNFFEPKSKRIALGPFLNRFGKKVPAIQSRDSAGRPVKVMLSGGRTISGYEFWLEIGRNFGWGRVPGTRYRIKPVDEDWIEIISSGAGHGIGLCQWGAAEQARQGKVCNDILRYYFRNVEVKSLSSFESGIPGRLRPGYRQESAN